MSFNEYDGLRADLFLVPAHVDEYGNKHENTQEPDSSEDQAGSLEVKNMYHAAHAGANDSGLSDRDRGILEFERQWWKYAGAKEQAIRELFDMSATRYYQVINNLIDTPEAMEFDPMLVKRLRRMRASRQQARSANRVSS